MLGQARRLTPREGGPPAVVDALVACLTEAAAAAGVEVGHLEGIGVGVPGDVDVKAGTLARATNLSEWEHPVPLAALLSERLGVAATLGNDVSVAANAELLLGAGRGGLAAGCLLGDRRGRRRGARRQAMARSRRGGRDRPHGGKAGRGALSVWPARVHGGLCGASRDGSQGDASGGEGSPHRPVRDHARAQTRHALKRRVGARAGRTKTNSRSGSSSERCRRLARG